VFHCVAQLLAEKTERSSSSLYAYYATARECTLLVLAPRAACMNAYVYIYTAESIGATISLSRCGAESAARCA
jgi:hypothetical protein